jgi:hypothetical protein
MALSNEDKVSIHELFSRFYNAFDEGNAAGAAAAFDHQGIFVLREGGRDAPSPEVAGSSAIEAAMDKHFEESCGPRAKHFLTNMVCEDHPVGALVTFYIMNVNIVSGPEIVGTALGECLVCRKGQDWRIARFDHYIDPTYLNRTTKG